MLKELFERLVGFCTDQASIVPRRLDFAPNKRSLLYWDPATKKVVTSEIDPPWNKHLLLSVDDAIKYVKHLVTDWKRAPVLWIGDDAVVIETQEHEHRHVLSMPLRVTPLWALLKELAKASSVPQERAIRLVRQDFAAFDIGSAALTAVRSLKISRLGEDVSDQSHVSSRIGKSMLQDASGATQLPEFLECKAPIFIGTEARKYSVRVWLSVDFSKPGHVRFEPDETAMAEAIQMERESLTEFLRAQLAGVTTNIFQGEYRVAS